jgi:hypothetical protein
MRGMPHQQPEVQSHKGDVELTLAAEILRFPLLTSAKKPAILQLKGSSPMKVAMGHCLRASWGGHFLVPVDVSSRKNRELALDQVFDRIIGTGLISFPFDIDSPVGIVD